MAQAKAYIPAIVTLMVLAGMALVVLVVASSGEGAGTSMRQQPGDDGDGMTQSSATGRDHLSVCVDGAGGARVSEREIDMVQGALDAVLQAAPDPPPEFGDATTSAGCPPPVGLTGEVHGYGDRGGLELPARALEVSEHPSRHVLHVYFVPASVYTASFGIDAYATTQEEYVCPTDRCSSKTLGLYVKPGAMTDLLRRALRGVLGLIPREPDLAEVREFCATDTPEEWCFALSAGVWCRARPADRMCALTPTASPQ